MLSASVIVLREAFEASLVIGLVLAFLRKTGRSEHHASCVWGGVAAAIVVSAVLGALLFLTAGELQGEAEELFEGAAKLLAACVLTGMLFWMRRQAATIGGQLRAQVGEALETGSRMALGLVAFVAVAREGIETALFLFASMSNAGGGLTTVAGGLIGLAAAIVLGVGFYRGSLQLDLGRFFLVTGLLVIVFAAYLLAGGVGALGEATGNGLAEPVGAGLGVLYAVVFGVAYWRAARAPQRRADTAAADAQSAAQ